MSVSFLLMKGGELSQHKLRVILFTRTSRAHRLKKRLQISSPLDGARLHLFPRFQAELKKKAFGSNNMFVETTLHKALSSSVHTIKKKKKCRKSFMLPGILKRNSYQELEAEHTSAGTFQVFTLRASCRLDSWCSFQTCAFGSCAGWRSLSLA